MVKRLEERVYCLVIAHFSLPPSFPLLLTVSAAEFPREKASIASAFEVQGIHSPCLSVCNFTRGGGTGERSVSISGQARL